MGEPDILAQLRKSHFWVVFASCALLMVPSLPLATGYQNAEHQLSKLMQINATLTQASLAESFARLQLPSAATLDWTQVLGQAPWHYRTTSCHFTTRFFLGGQQTWSKPVVWMTMPGDDTAYAVPYQLPPVLEMKRSARTLIDARRAWAFLNNDNYAFVIVGARKLSATEYRDVDLSRHNAFGPGYHEPAQCLFGDVKWFSAQRAADDPILGYFKIRGFVAAGSSLLTAASRPLAGDSFESGEIPVQIREVKIPLFAAHLDRLFSDSRPDLTILAGERFSDAFPDLTRISKGLGTLTLDGLRGYTERMAEEGGTDVEILGAKLPVDIFVRWGIPLLLIMQVYFWLHVRRYANDAGSFPADARYPWIALYSDTASRWVTRCSLLLAPLAAAMLVHFGVEHRFVGTWIAWSLTAGALISAALALLTIMALSALNSKLA